MLSESSLEKKRKFQEERTARLLDPRIRVLGVDKKALDEQIEEKNRVKELEKQREQFFDRQALMMDKHAQCFSTKLTHYAFSGSAKRWTTATRSKRKRPPVSGISMIHLGAKRIFPPA